MPTIRTDQPSTGKPAAVRLSTLSDAGRTTLYECPNYSIPVREDEGIIVEDADGLERQIVDGEALFITPLNVTNNATAPGDIRLIIVSQDGEEFIYINWISVPAGETVQLPVQGLSLLRQNNPPVGDTLQVEVSAGSDLSVYAMVSEAEAGTHAPDTEAIF
jgi:hypothetical protein